VKRMTNSSPSPPSQWWWRAPEFVRSLPLFFGALVFFAAAVVLRVGFPKYAAYGPGVFSFWTLLLALGFTCTIGGVVSWTLAGDPEPSVETTATPSPSPAYLPIEFPEPSGSPNSSTPTAPPRSRSDFGRPTPDIRSTGAAVDWYESPTDSELFIAPRAPAPEIPPTPEPTAPMGGEALEPVEQVLADLERIERDLAPRSRVVDPSPA
jgi:hypothetical protein